MALDAVVYPQDLFGCTCKEFLAFGEARGSEFVGGVEEEEKGVSGSMGKSQEDHIHHNWDPSCSFLVHNFEEWDVRSSPPESCRREEFFTESFAIGAEASASNRKKRRARSCKNKEEIENQRMTHITVERNRRKLMNEYLALVRSLMPPSYVQRGDQASIIGGAINYVKELEQLLQTLEVQKQIKQQPATTISAPFADFFTFPQYSIYSSPACSNAATTRTNTTTSVTQASEAAGENRPALADIEVTMVESYASLKVLSRRRPKQLLKLVADLHSLRLTTFHLNVTSADQMVLYCFSLKVEEDCPLTSADEIAAAVHQTLEMIEEQSAFT